MKKSIFILIISLISFNSFSQSENENKVTFDSTTYIGTAIINVPGVSKDELYKRVKLWISSAYKSGKTVTDLDDKSGDVYTIVLKARHDTHVVYIKGMNEYDEENSYTVILKIKDGKLKMEIKDWFNLGYQGSYSNGAFTNVKPSYGHTKKTWNQVREEVADFTNELLNSFSNEMLNPARSNDDF
jgi:hypothetical protein